MSILEQYESAVRGLEQEIVELEAQPRAAHPEYSSESLELAVRAGATARSATVRP